MAHISEAKKKVVKEFVDLIKQYPIVGAINMQGLPAPQLQNMRESLRDTVVLKMTKRRLIRIALEEAKADKPGVEKIIEHLEGMPALLFTKENPFKLFKQLKKSKSPAPAKAGQIAPKDIIVKAGATPFMPGPVIGELAVIGVKSGVEGGKVAIKEDSVVCKKGETVKPEVAAILARLGINPMEVGLDLVATVEDGLVYTKDILDIDQDEFMDKLGNAAAWAFNLSVESAYTTKENIELLLIKTFRESKGLAMEAAIMADLVAEELVTKAERQMLGVKSTAKIETGVAKPAAPKAEKPKEDKPEPKVEKKAPTPKVEEPKVEEKAPEPKVEEKAPTPKVEEPKAEEKLVEEAEQKAEVEPEVIKAEEAIKEDIQKLEKEMQKEVNDAETKEEKQELEEKKEIIEKEVVEDLKEDLPEAKEIIEKSKDDVPSAEELVKATKNKEPKKPEPVKVPSAHELLAEKNKRAQLEETGQK